MKGEISHRDQNYFLYQAVNMFISAVKLGVLTWGSMGNDSLLKPASSGHSRNCNPEGCRVVKMFTNWLFPPKLFALEFKICVVFIKTV